MKMKKLPIGVSNFKKMIEKAIDENIILKEVTLRDDLLWSFLLMVAGLLIWISNTHEIKSNRESGYGTPPGIFPGITGSFPSAVLSFSSAA